MPPDLSRQTAHPVKDEQKLKHSKSNCASTNSDNDKKRDGKERERTRSPKEENRTKPKTPSPSRKSSDSQTSEKGSVKSQWSSDGELPEGVTCAADLARHRRGGSGQSSRDGDNSPSRRSPPGLKKEKSLDSFGSLDEMSTEKLGSNMNRIRMKKGWLDGRISADREKDAEYDRQVEGFKRESRHLQRE